jgi:putative peptidoglycan lipid II flippase
MGLAFASDIGIAMQTLAIAGLLHRRKMVSLANLDYREMGRCLVAAVAGGGTIWIVFSFLADVGLRAIHGSGHGRMYNAVVLIAGGLLWGGVALGVLKRTGSALPSVMRKRLRLA